MLVIFILSVEVMLYLDPNQSIWDNNQHLHLVFGCLGRSNLSLFASSFETSLMLVASETYYSESQ